MEPPPKVPHFNHLCPELPETALRQCELSRVRFCPVKKRRLANKQARPLSSPTVVPVVVAVMMSVVSPTAPASAHADAEERPAPATIGSPIGPDPEQSGP